MEKKTKKKIAVILFFAFLMLAMLTDVQSGPGIDGKPKPDYGVYNALEEIQNEKNSRINSPEILAETEGRFDNITLISGEEKVDLTSRRDVVTPEIPKPEMLPIYEAMLEWNQFLHDDILNWLLPGPFGGGPMNYCIYTKYITNTSVTETWTNASLRPTLIWPETNIDSWWGVDVDNDTLDDIDVLFEPGIDYAIGEIWNRIINGDPIEVGVTVHYNVRRARTGTLPFDEPDFKGLEVYVAKSMSYSGQNFLLFIGLNLTNVVTELDCSVTVDKVRMDNVEASINWSTFPPTVEIEVGDLADLSGPYSIEWDSYDEELASFGLDVATAKVKIEDDKYEFLNRSWVDLDFKKRYPSYYTVPTWAKLWIDADDDFVSFDNMTWEAGDICDAYIKFFDSQENVTYAEVEIDDLQDDIRMSMTVHEENGRNISVIEYYSPHGWVNYLRVDHYEFFDIEYEDITAEGIASGDVEYLHLFVNISRIPRRLYLEGIFYLEEIEETPSIDPGFGMIAQLVDTIAHRVISRFTRIARTLGSIPYRLLSIAGEGSSATVHTKNTGDIDEIEFVFTSGDYATPTENYTGNYFVFYNNTHASEYPVAQISLSGRMSKVNYFNSSFEEDAFAEVKMMKGQEFRAIYADDINSLNAEVIISGFPEHIFVQKTPNRLIYDGKDTSIEELRFLSDYQNSYMDLRISDLADFIYVDYDENRTHIYTGETQDKIGEIEFLVTTGPIYRMNGNHLLLRQEEGFSLLSGRIKDVSTIDYTSGEDGKLEISFIEENCMNISLFDNRSELLSADLIMDPVPEFISLNLSGILSAGVADFKLPELRTGGVLGFANLMFGIATLGNELMGIIDETVHTALNNIGNIIEDLSFSYSTTTSITLIGKIQRGDDFALSDIDWMHGLSARQQGKEEGTSMVAKVYLTGLPRVGSISTQVVGDDVHLDLHFEDYTPKYDWLSVDVRGLQDRDVMLYLNDIQDGMDLDLNILLFTQLNVIPQSAFGLVHMNSNKDLGSLYGRMKQTEPEISISEIFLSSIPRSLDTTFVLSGVIGIDFQASNGIEYMFVKNTRTRDKEFHDIYAILHEIPDAFSLSLSPAKEYDMDGSLLQTMPSLNITSSGSTLDAYIFADGKGIGQVGIVELQVVNAAEFLSGEFSDDEYSVTSTGVDYLWVHAMELPLMEGHKTKSVEIVGKDIKSFDLKVHTLFGNYPVFGIDNAKGGEVQVVINHEADDSKAGIALIDFKTKNGLPLSPSVLINGGSIDLEEGTSHLVVPAPILTFLLSVFS